MIKKRKILVITLSFPTKVNQAAGVFILNQLEYLKKYYDIKVIAPYPYAPPFKFLKSHKFSKIPFKEKMNGIEVYRPRYLMFPRNKLTFKFINIILIIETFFSLRKSKNTINSLAKRWDFDIIHAHGFVPDSIIAVKCKKKYNKPLAITLHGEDITKYSKMLFLKYLSKFVLKKCDKIICVSKSLKNEIYQTNLSKKQIEVIPSGYNVRRFRRIDMKKCRKLLNLSENKKIILFIGHLVERKGIVYLIRALKILSRKNKDFLCYIVGKGILEKKLKSIASELDIENKIIFVGEKSPDEIPLWTNACDILVLPSLNEGLPNVISEALACEKPVVATNVSGTPELVNKDVGYLVRPKDINDLANKIILALNRKWNKEKLLKRAQEFSVTRSVEKLREVYKKF